MLLSHSSVSGTPSSHQLGSRHHGTTDHQHNELSNDNCKSSLERRDSVTESWPLYTALYPSHHCHQRHDAASYRSWQSNPSMDYAFAVPELLENILLFVDQRLLLTSCLRVDKTWHSLITTSPSLQRHLFFRPMTSSQPVDSCKTPTWNPLLTWGFPNWFGGSQYPQRLDVKTGVRRNPRDSFSFFDAAVAETFYALPWARNWKAWSREEASWRHMQITQQPIRALHVRTALDTYGERTDYTGTATFLETEVGGGGLCMGELYDYVTRNMENFHFSSKTNDWICADGTRVDGRENSPWTCKSMAEPCHMHEGTWCMELHIYQPFYSNNAFEGELDKTKFRSKAPTKAFQVFSVEDGHKL